MPNKRQHFFKNYNYLICKPSTTQKEILKENLEELPGCSWLSCSFQVGSLKIKKEFIRNKVSFSSNFAFICRSLDIDAASHSYGLEP
jgi:hypothetical protein